MKNWITAVAFMSCAGTLAAQSTTPDPATRTLAVGIFKQLIEINTTDSVGNVSTASLAMRQRLLDAGFDKQDIFIGGPTAL